MRNPIRYGAPIIAAILFSATVSTVAFAETLTWSIKSDYEYQVSLEFYSEDRDHVWPGGGDIWLLDDYDVHEFPLECRAGETICYGAWVTGDPDIYWGSGYDGEEACDDCCAVCGGGDLPTIILDP